MKLFNLFVALVRQDTSIVLAQKRFNQAVKRGQRAMPANTPVAVLPSLPANNGSTAPGSIGQCTTTVVRSDGKCKREREKTTKNKKGQGSEHRTHPLQQKARQSKKQV